MRLFRLRKSHGQWCETGASNSLILTLSTSSLCKPTLTPPSSRRLVSSRSKQEMEATANYMRWTKESLIERVQQLEKELKAHDKSKRDIPPPTTEHTAHDASSSIPPSSVDANAFPSDGPAKKKAKKTGTTVLDRSRYTTRYIALKFAYLGKQYNGFEYQVSGRLSTIEEELWKALVKACLVFPDPARSPHEVDWNVCEYSKCGRTDRGVSAFGQVVALRVRSNKPVASATATKEKGSMADGEGGIENSSPPVTEEVHGNEEVDEDDDTPYPVEKEIPYCRMLNRLLPPDIRVYAWCPNPPPDFSARFSCRERQYRYFFTQPAFAPLPNFIEKDSQGRSKSQGKEKRPKDGWLDIDAMRQAAKLFEGLHDFRNFCKVDPTKQITNYVRRIYEADIVEVDGADSSLPYLSGPQFCDPNITSASSSSPHQPQQRYPKVYYFHVRGSAFLWHQIRCMVAVLFLVGQGLEPPSLVSTLLDVAQTPRRPNYTLADDAPLVLWDCLFGRDEAEEAPDEVEWVYIGSGRTEGGSDAPSNLYGPAGLAADLWTSWRERKMDEILAGRLVGFVAHKTDIAGGRAPPAGEGASTSRVKTGRSTRVFEGGNAARSAGQYVPVLKKALLPSPEEQNDRWAQRKGFESAEEMRGRGNWREIIREAKKAGGE